MSIPYHLFVLATMSLFYKKDTSIQISILMSYSLTVPTLDTYITF